ncbi:MAG: hypothetical protein H6581_10115 [Bacteroidia bacterium]|nr:hypothetical protein [Bacteroidia bacterium]
MTYSLKLQILLYLVFFLPFSLFAQNLSPEKTILRTYEWTYQGKTYSLENDFSRAALSHYRSLPRHSQYGLFTAEHPAFPVLKPMVRELKTFCKNAGFTEWETAGFVIAFVQSLEYQKETTSPEYPKYPIETLVDQGGDCEDTAILLASLLRDMGISSILLNPRGHMATGVAVSGLKGSYLTWEGRKYYYVETTSPNWKIGQIPEEYNSEMTIYTIPGIAATKDLAWNASPGFHPNTQLQLAFVRGKNNAHGTNGNGPAYTWSVRLEGSPSTLSQIKSVGYLHLNGTFQEDSQNDFTTRYSAQNGFQTQLIGHDAPSLKVKVTFKDGRVEEFACEGEDRTSMAMNP